MPISNSASTTLVKPEAPSTSITFLEYPTFPFPASSTLTLRAPSSILIAAGRTNIPYPSRHEKYDFPWTVPLCFPFFPSNSTPIHFPWAKEVDPANRTVPGPLTVETRSPTTTEVSIKCRYYEDVLFIAFVEEERR